MSVRRPLLLALVLVFTAAVLAGGLLLPAGDPAEKTGSAATPSPDFTPPPPVAPTGPPVGRPAVPTPEPGREGPETTLVDTISGGTVRLWEPGYRIHETVFSGGFLYYVRFPVGTGVQDAEILALNLETHQTATKIADGYNIAISANGDIAYSVWDPGGAHSAAIYDRFGRTQSLSDGSGRFAWSPDGRWLTYSGAYQGDAPMKQYIFDATTHQTRQFTETLPCNCDGGPSVQWAPDSAHFIFARLAPDATRSGPDGRPTVRYIHEVYLPAGGVAVDAPNAQAWLSASVYLASESRQEAGIYRNYHTAVDIRTGAASPVFEAGWGTAYGVSPDGAMMAASDQFTTRIVDRNGTVVLDGAAGEYHLWSPDARFVLTGARSSSCGAALLVIRVADGEQVACSPAGPGAGGAFNPDSTKVAMTVSRWLVTPPPGSATPVTNDLVITDLASGVSRTVATDMRGYLGCVKWPDDGRYVVVGVCGGV